MLRRPPISTLFPTRRSSDLGFILVINVRASGPERQKARADYIPKDENHYRPRISISHQRSEEHTSELQSLRHLVCRLLLEKKKIQLKGFLCRGHGRRVTILR